MQDAKRANPLNKFTDARVDVALFFIPPHSLRPFDVDFIVDLARLVPVVCLHLGSGFVGAALLDGLC